MGLEIFIGLVVFGMFGLVTVLGLVRSHGQGLAKGDRVPRETPSDPAVDNTPLPGYVRRNYLANFNARTLIARDPDCMELRFGGGAKFGGVVSLVAGFWLSTMVFAMLRERLDEVLVMAIMHGVGGLALILSGIYLLMDLGRTSFDRSANQWTVHHCFGEPTSRPLDDILAIQLISGGIHKSEHGDYESFQINLVLNDGEEPRQNLLEHHESPGLRQMARQLAEFLQIPMLDMTVLPPL